MTERRDTRRGGGRPRIGAEPLVTRVFTITREQAAWLDELGGTGNRSAIVRAALTRVMRQTREKASPDKRRTTS